MFYSFISLSLVLLYPLSLFLNDLNIFTINLNTYNMFYLCPWGKPSTPTIRSDNKNPIEGERVTLTCESSSTGITSYRFFRNPTINNQQATPLLVATEKYNSYTISAVDIENHKGAYTCQVFKNGIGSDSSTVPGAVIIEGLKLLWYLVNAESMIYSCHFIVCLKSIFKIVHL